METSDFMIDIASLSLAELCAFVVELKYHILLDHHNDIQDRELLDMIRGYRNFLVTPEIADGFVNHITLEAHQKRYLKSCPCFDCKLNLPCSICGIITPFDILDARGKYRMACRPRKHMCLKCKISR